MYIPGIEKLQADFLSWQPLDPWVWSLHPRGVQDLCFWWGALDMDLLASRFNNKLERYRDDIMEAVDALVSLWNQNTLISMSFLP